MLIVALFAMAVVAMPAFAGPGCSKTCAKTCGVSAKMCATDKTDDKAKIGSAEKCVDAVLAVDGMTCPGCEGKVTKALESVDGVIRVLSVDHQSGKAFVCFDPAKTEAAKLAEIIKKEVGYKAKEVAMTDDDKTFVQKKCTEFCKTKEDKDSKK